MENLIPKCLVYVELKTIPDVAVMLGQFHLYKQSYGLTKTTVASYQGRYLFLSCCHFYFFCK